MSFDPDLTANQQELLQRVQAIGKCREESAALRRGDRRELWKDADFYVYARYTASGDAAIVAMNKSGSTRTETVTVPAELGVEGMTLTDAIGGGSVTVSGGSITVDLDSWQYSIYVN